MVTFMFTANFFARRFQINCGLDGSSMSSPLDSPDVPITCSVATLQSAESLSIRRQVRLAELSSGQFNDLLVANPHFALIHTLLSSSASDESPETPSAKVTPSLDSSPTYNSYFLPESALPRCQVLLEDSPQSPSAALTSSSDSPDADAPKPQDVDYLKFYDEFWEMTKFEYDLQCISTSYFNSDSIDKPVIAESKF